jgi:hypothetical protein
VISKPIADVTDERNVVLAWIEGTRQTRRSHALVDFCRLTFLGAGAETT